MLIAGWNKGLIGRAVAIIITFATWSSWLLGPFITRVVIGSRVIGGVVSHTLDLDSALGYLMPA